MASTHHVIEITLKGTKVVPAAIPPLKVGDTVLYSYTGAGDLLVVFTEGSPYRTNQDANTEVPGNKKLTITQDGKFPMGCQIVLPNNNTIGWNAKDPNGTKDSGGTHDVRKP
jgi:hypothetical protein